MKESRPVLVTYISDLNFLNVFLLIISLFPKLLNRFGIITPEPTLSNIAYRIVIIVILLSISYGLLKLRSWGYWLMVAYNMFFLLGSLFFIFRFPEYTNYFPNFIVSILGLSLTFSAKRYFVKAHKTA
jgi:predicted membrane channel-forming protein YqfA (hemolysin III family)